MDKLKLAVDALEPCPFCGGRAEVFHLHEGENAGGSCVSCTRCLASSNVEFGRKENFVSNWNRRALAAIRAPEAPGEVEALCEDSEELCELLKAGVPSAGMHDDNATELFDIEEANGTMYDAFTLIRQQQAAIELLRATVADITTQAGIIARNGLTEKLRAEAAEAEVARLREALTLTNSHCVTMLSEHAQRPKVLTRPCVAHWQHIERLTSDALTRAALTQEPGR